MVILFVPLSHLHADTLIHLYVLRWSGGDDIVERRLLDALVLTFWNLASSNQFVKNKATVDVTGMSIISRCYAITASEWWGTWQFGCIYAYRREVCVARFD